MEAATQGDPRGSTPEGAQLGGSTWGLDLTVTVSVEEGTSPRAPRRKTDCQLAELAEEGGFCGSWGP